VGLGFVENLEELKREFWPVWPEFWSLGSASTAVQKYKIPRLLTNFDMLYLPDRCIQLALFMYRFVENNVNFLNHIHTWSHLLWYARQSCKMLKFRRNFYAKEKKSIQHNLNGLLIKDLKS
jgi:hypothetical protein